MLPRELTDMIRILRRAGLAEPYFGTARVLREHVGMGFIALAISETLGLAPEFVMMECSRNEPTPEDVASARHSLDEAGLESWVDEFCRRPVGKKKASVP